MKGGVVHIRLRSIGIFLVISPIPPRIAELLEVVDVCSGWLAPAVEVHGRAAT